jgi:hypothetical protein
MKRFTLLFFSCVALAGSAWLTHVVWGQAADTKEKTFTITQSQLDKYVADQIAKAGAADHKDKPVTDEQVLKLENWHRAVFNKMEFVVYTGPGQAMMHHWVDTGKPTTPKSGTGSAPKSGGAATPPSAGK